MINNFNEQNMSVNQPTIEINTENQNQEARVETDEEILEKARDYIVEIRKRDKEKIKIEGDLIIDSQGTWVDTNKYYNPIKDMFDNSFYAFLKLTKTINGFISHYTINEKINDLIKILKENYLKLKEQYSSNVDYEKQIEILSNAEILYMITYYIHRKIMVNKKDKNRYILPSRLIDFLYKTKDFGTIYYPDDGYHVAGKDFTSKYKLKDWKELKSLMTKIAIYIDDANGTACDNYFETE